MSLACAWLLTCVVHIVVLLGIAALVDLSVRPLRSAWRETLWRAALFGGLLTSSTQMLSYAEPLAGRWLLSASAPAAAPQASNRVAARAPSSDTAVPTARHVAGFPAPAVRTVERGGERSRAAATPPSAVALPVVPGGHWLEWLLVSWIGGFLVSLARIVTGLARLRGALARARPLDARRAGVSDAFAGHAAPALSVLDDLAGPIAVRGRRIVLPRWAVEQLDAAQLQAMVAHEFGHIVRRDPEWKIAIAIWRAALWFLPPVALAQRRLDALAELACDAFAAQHTGDARGLAECLATCAEHQMRGRAFDLAPAMSGRSSLVERVERLLDGVYVDTSASGAVARSLAAIVLAGAVFSLPAFGVDTALLHAAPPAQRAPSPPATPAAPALPVAKAAHSSVSVHSDGAGDTMVISLSDDAHKFSAQIDGKIAFDEAETEVVSLSPGGRATFDETRDGVRRRLQISEHDGKLDRRYSVDGSQRPIDAAAQAWTASIVKQLERSGIGAEERVRRIHARGGADAVLTEITQLTSDYVRGIYLRALVDLGKLSPAEVERAVQLAGAMQSDYERRLALSAVFDKQALGPAEQVTFLRQAMRFDSDYERAELLVGVVPRLADSVAVRAAWLDAGLKVKSDYERRRTLNAMLERNALDDTQLASIIAASDSMQSAYEHRELLVAAARRLRNADAVAAPYAQSARRIASDYERREALLALIKTGTLGAAGCAAVLDAAATIGSGYERREVLIALAHVMPADAGLQARYRDLARQLGDYDRDEAERALAR